MAPQFDAMVGAGALLPFARVGINAEARQLELAPGPQVEADGIERLVVPDPGVFLGFKLAPPVPGALTEPAYLPRFHEVFEGGAAARLGIVPGDFLLMIGERICAAQPPGVLYRELWLRAGDTVSLTVRKADGRTVIVRLP